MTQLTRFLRAAVVALLAAGALLPGASPALANGLGDLYVAADRRVDEVFLAGGQVVNTVDLSGSGTGLAFTPDGTSLYVADDHGELSRIDIETISLAQTYALAREVTALAHPKGTSLFLATAGAKAVSVLPDGDSSVTDGPLLPGVPDLLAADRHELRLVAARRGEPWVAIVEPTSAAVTKVAPGGAVVAIAVARDEGAAYVITTGPDRLARIALDTGKVTWNVGLPAEPVAVTAVPGAAVVAARDELLRVTKTAAVPWATGAGLPGPVRQLATSDEGAFVYAATGERVVAVSVAKPDATPAANVAVSGAVSLAPVPKASSLVPKGGEAAGQGSPGSSPSAAPQGAVPTRPPSTDTTSDARWQRPGPEAATLVGGFAAIAVVVLVVSRALLRRSMGER